MLRDGISLAGQQIDGVAYSRIESARRGRLRWAKADESEGEAEDGRLLEWGFLSCFGPRSDGGYEEVVMWE